MNAEIRLENNFLSFRCPDAGVDERRAVSPDDVDKFDSWIDRYRDALEDKRRLEKILVIGKDIFDWLDGNSGVMQKLLNHVSDGLVIEFAVKPRPDKNDQRFLEVPWELLASDGQHLTADEFLSFCPIRRIGAAETPQSPSEFRLSAVFMAAAPRNAGSPLRYEEEEAAIIEAAGNIGMDLTVEESGSLPLLAELLAQETADVLHISCHGNNEPEPLLALEDEEGNRKPAAARDINDALGIHKPKLLFLSACLTSEPNKLINSMSTAMIRYGVPAVLGWGGSVKDVEAIRFAHALYESLSRANTLERAISDARTKLLLPDEKNPKPSEDWHLARLYMGKSGGGIFSGTKARSLSGTERGNKEFLDAKTSRIPVASRREFVGRRREIQTILREFRKPEHAGVLIHGLGHQGKSSLAARIANRMNQHKPVVVFGNYDAESVLAAIRTGFQTAEITDAVERSLPRIRKDPAYLTIAIREILETTCRDNPMLLVMDDLERILEDPRNQELHRVRSDCTDVMRAVIQAFDRAETRSRLMLTSRFAFTLPSAQGNDLAEKLLDLPLPAMEPYENEKQAILKAKYGNTKKSATDPERTKRCIRASKGNPGLCDLLFSLSLENPKACDEALDEMEAYIRSGVAPSQQKLSDFLENLAITHLLDLLSAPEKKLLRDSAMFIIPTPLKTLRLLAESVGAGIMAEHRLIGLGLWEVYVDIFDPKEPAAAINALVKPVFKEPDDAEKETIAKVVVRDLFERWGGNEGRKRPYIADIELAKLALAGKDTTVAAATGKDALRGLEKNWFFGNLWSSKNLINSIFCFRLFFKK